MANCAHSSFIKRPVTIIKRVTPSCFEAVLDPNETFAQQEDYTFNRLDIDINEYYNNYDIVTEKTLMPKRGEMIVVCHPIDQKWYRAKMITTIETTKGYFASVHLMDMNRKVNVPFRSVRKLHEAFSMYPPRGVTLELFGLLPCTLQYNADTLKSEPRVSRNWDTHAYSFIDDALKRKEETLFTVFEVVHPERFLGNLYFRLGGQLCCLNELLVEKHYAVFKEACDNALDNDVDDVPLGASATTYSLLQSSADVCGDHSPLQQRPCSALEEWQALRNELQKKARDSGCDIEHPIENQNFQVSRLSRGVFKICGSLREPDRDTCDHSENSTSFVLPGNVSSPEVESCKDTCTSFSNLAEDSQYPKSQIPSPTPVVSCSDNRMTRYSLPRGSVLSPLQSFETVDLPNVKAKSDASSDVSNVSSIGTGIVELTLKGNSVPSSSKDGERTVEKSQLVASTISRSSSQRSQKRLSPSELLKRFSLSPPQPIVASFACSGKNEPVVSCQPISKKLDKPVSTNGVDCESSFPSPSREKLNKPDCNGGGTGCVATVVVSPKAHLTRLCDALKIAGHVEMPLPTTAGEPKESHSSTAKGLFESLAECATAKPNSQKTNAMPSLKHHVGEIQRRVLKISGDTTTTNDEIPESAGDPLNDGLSADITKKDSIDRDVVRHSSTHRFIVTPPTNPNFSTSMGDPLGLDSASFRRILVCGQNSPKPIREITKASFNSFIAGRLGNCNIEYPSTIQSYAWPSVMRGRNVAAISGPRSGKTCSYLLPLLSFILDNVMYNNVPPGNEPVALVICAFWRSATQVYDQCMKILHGCQSVRALLIHGGGYDDTQKIQLLNGCDLLIATPCAVLRILRGNGTRPTSLNRLCHLILDEADILTEEFAAELMEIIEEYAAVLKLRKLQNVPCQILTFACKWTLGLKSFISNVMPNPLFYCSSFCESIIFAGIKTIAHTYSLEERPAKLMEILRPNLTVNEEKIVICTSNRESATDLYRILSYVWTLNSVKLASEDLSPSEVLRVGEDWRANHPKGKQPILIVTDKCLEELNIEDADCLIHYDIPEVYKSQFGLRFSCLLKHMQRISITETSMESVPPCVCHIITTSNCVLQAHGLIQLLKRLSSKIPTLLYSLALGFYQGGEERKEPVPFCSNIKAFGQCSNQYWCKERHILLPDTDDPSSSITRGGLVRLHITDVRNATWFHARVIKYQKDDGKWAHVQPTFLALHTDMSSFFVKRDNCLPHLLPRVGDMCAIIGKDNGYYRVRVLEKPSVMAHTNIHVVSVLLVDLGRIDSVVVTDLLQLPARFCACPPQTVEVFMCNLRPVDKDHAWTNRACVVVDDMICGQDVIGKVMLCLGRIVWLSSLVRQTKLRLTGEYINEFNLRQELLARQFAIDNPMHLPTLEHLAQEVFTLPPPIERLQIAGGNAGAPECLDNNSFAFLRLEENEKIHVSCLTNPGRFFVMKVASYDCLENLMNELEDYKKENPKPVQHITLGMFCVAVFPKDGGFYRGKVIEILPNTSDPFFDDDIRIFYVDYGDEDVVKAKFVYPLQHKYIWKLPFQAIKCSLAGVIPISASGWTEEASNFMWSDTLNSQELMVLALKKNTHCVDDGFFYEVELRGMMNTIEINFADRLCCNNHACCVANMESQIGTESENREHCENAEVSNGFEDRNKIREVDHEKSSTANHSQFPCENDKQSVECAGIKPRVIWSDAKDSIMLRIMICGVKQHSLAVTLNHLLYKTRVENCLYELDVNLFDDIEDYSCEIQESCVKMQLKKKKLGKWPRLLNEKLKYLWLCVDFDKLMESSDEGEKEHVPELTNWQELKGTKKETTSIPRYRPDGGDSTESDSSNSDVVVSDDSLISERNDPFDLF